MKHTKHLSILAAFFILLFSVQVFAQQSETDWLAFSENLEVALRKGNTGLQQSAMQRVISYADKLTLDDGVYRIGRIFQFGTDEYERRLAMVALAKINTVRSIAYIYDGMIRETNKSVKKQGCCILNEFCLANMDVTDEDFKLALQQDK